MRPEGVDGVVAAVRGLRDAGACAVVVGGGTLSDIADPSPDHCERLDTTALDGVAAYEPADLTCTVGAGTTLRQLEATLAPEGQRLPVWHPAPGRATIGGLVAFGWTGLGRSLYGPLRDRILEVRVVTGEGKEVRGGGRVVKNVTGFDLPRLFCGSMGTLGVVCEVTLKVHPGPEVLSGVVQTGDEPSGLALAVAAGAERARMPTEAVLAKRDGVWSGYGFAPGPSNDANRLLAAFEGFEEAEPGAFDALATDPVLCPETGGWEPEVTVARISAPPAKVLELAPLLTGASRAVLDVRSGAAWAAFPSGGLAATLRGFAEGAGGSCVLLHASTALRRRIGTWGRPPQGVEIMRQIKTQFDPDGVLGPGRFVL